MLTDIEIAHRAHLVPILSIAQDLGLSEDDIELYGKYKAKVHLDVLDRLQERKDGKLILVTAVNPTPAGEGKTTTTVGLGQALKRIGKQAVIALREPSLGPVMGLKGGAAGGGYSQVVPMEDINLHFTGDLHAITAAHNLLSALIDNHIHQGNALGIDVNQIVWKRALDMNDRALRNVVVGLGGSANGVPREDGFMITVASEVMAVLCLSSGLDDLKERLGSMIVAYNMQGQPVLARDLNAQGAMATLLKDAILPNLVQTLENTPCFIHGGPFANIAHGCNSITATKMALKLGDYVVTEAGFGADLGAEKFLDIKCPLADIAPDAVVIVATVRALKYNGGLKKDALEKEDITALKKGLPNLEKHIENMLKYGVPVVVAINAFATDTEAEIALIKQACAQFSVQAVLSEAFAKGGAGAEELAQAVVEAADSGRSNFCPLYSFNLSVEEKIETIVKEIYGGAGVQFSPQARKKLRMIHQHGFDKMPICMAKTQYSLSDNPKLLGQPDGFTVTIRDLQVSNGAGFIVALAGDIMTMPGLPKAPAAERIDIDRNGMISGLF